MIFNYDTYSGSLKTQTLTIGDELFNKFYGSYPANMGELLSVDWQPSSGSLWLLEINTCILLMRRCGCVCFKCVFVWFGPIHRQANK